MFFSSSDLRVADADREAVAEFLKRHYAAGRLTDAELSARVDAAYAARHESQLRRLTRDLPALPPERRARRPVAVGPGSAAAAAALVVLIVALAAVLPPEAWAALLGVGLLLLVIAVVVIAPVALPLAAVVVLVRAIVRPRRRLPVAHRLPLGR